MLGVTRYQQWQQRLTSKALASSGMEWSIPDIIMDPRVEWLGHLWCMEDERLPKVMLFGELIKKRPWHGTRKRWRDQMSGDLQAVGINESWYQLCQDRKQWLATCQEGVDEVASCRKMNTCTANRHSQDRPYVCVSGEHLEDKD